jgi:hypothetical protein
MRKLFFAVFLILFILTIDSICASDFVVDCYQKGNLCSASMYFPEGLAIPIFPQDLPRAGEAMHAA